MAAIGRWGPVQAHGGRTEGEPCTGLLDACDDWDVDAWLYAAKYWKDFAHQLRDVVVHHWGSDPAQWPELARHGDLAYNDADKRLAGDLGWSDGTKVESLGQIQKTLKLAMEAWALALEQFFNVTIDVGQFGYDASEDPDSNPPVIPPPELPDIGGGIADAVGSVTTAIKIAAVGLVLVVAVVALRRK